LPLDLPHHLFAIPFHSHVELLELEEELSEELEELFRGEEEELETEELELEDEDELDPSTTGACALTSSQSNRITRSSPA